MVINKDLLIFTYSYIYLFSCSIQEKCLYLYYLVSMFTAKQPDFEFLNIC